MLTEDTKKDVTAAPANSEAEIANEEPAPQEPTRGSWREAFLAAFQKARRQQKPRESRQELGRDKSKSLFLLVGFCVVLLLVFLGVFSRPKKKIPLPGENPRGEASLGRKVTPGQENSDPTKAVTPMLSADVRSSDPASNDQLTPEDIGRTSRTGMVPKPTAATVPATKTNPPQDYALSKVDFTDPTVGQGTTAPNPPPSPSSDSSPDLKKPSLVFVRSTETKPMMRPYSSEDTDETLALAAGTRLVARLQTPVSSAVPTPVVAVVEYNYERNGQIVLPAVYWMAYYRNGKLYRESCHTNNKIKAGRMLQQRMAQIHIGTFIGPKAERIRVEELAEDLLRDYRINGRKSKDDVDARWKLHLQPFFGHLRALHVTSDLLNRYVDQRQEENAKNATINRELAALKRMFNLGLEATPPKVGRVPHFPHLEERNVRKGFVEDEQYQGLAEASGKIGLWMRALFECGYAYGWRESELLNLRVRQVIFSDRTIVLDPGATKNDDGRFVEMTAKVYQLLRMLVSQKGGDEFVFTRENGKPVRDFRDAWYSICESAGTGHRICPKCREHVNETQRCTRCGEKWRCNQIKYVGLIFHDLRRTAVRNMVRAGVPERVAMQISGHRTRSVFDRYNIVNRRDIKEAVSKLERYRSEHQQNAPTGLLGLQNGSS